MENLNNLREALLHLHKTLLHFEEKQYEGKYGKIPSKGELFRLATSHPDFAWLRELSELIVGIDEMMDNKEAADKNKIPDLFNYAKKLLTADEHGNEFGKKYFIALQKDPAMAIAHGQVNKFLK